MHFPKSIVPQINSYAQAEHSFVMVSSNKCKRRKICTFRT